MYKCYLYKGKSRLDFQCTQCKEYICEDCYPVTSHMEETICQACYDFNKEHKEIIINKEK